MKRLLMAITRTALATGTISHGSSWISGMVKNNVSIADRARYWTVVKLIKTSFWLIKESDISHTVRDYTTPRYVTDSVRSWVGRKIINRRRGGG